MMFCKSFQKTLTNFKFVKEILLIFYNSKKEFEPKSETNDNTKCLLKQPFIVTAPVQFKQ